MSEPTPDSVHKSTDAKSDTALMRVQIENHNDHPQGEGKKRDLSQEQTRMTGEYYNDRWFSSAIGKNQYGTVRGSKESIDLG
jgi:hypothetical protein